MKKTVRTQRISIMLTKDERQKLTEMAAKEGLNVASWLRSLGLRRIIETEAK